MTPETLERELPKNHHKTSNHFKPRPTHRRRKSEGCVDPLQAGCPAGLMCWCCADFYRLLDSGFIEPCPAIALLLAGLLPTSGARLKMAVVVALLCTHLVLRSSFAIFCLLDFFLESYMFRR
jgi:hypothetical protein